jgi:transposase
MERRKFSRELKIEAAKMVSERGMSVAQASRDLDVHQTVLRKWVKELSGSAREAFPGHGQMKQNSRRYSGCAAKWPSSRRSATY